MLRWLNRPCSKSANTRSTRVRTAASRCRQAVSACLANLTSNTPFDVPPRASFASPRLRSPLLYVLTHRGIPQELLGSVPLFTRLQVFGEIGYLRQFIRRKRRQGGFEPLGDLPAH